MSKTDSPHSTPVSGLNRRGLLAGAGGLAAAGAVAALPARALPAGAQFSPEFLEYRRLWQRYCDLCDLPEPAFGSAEAHALEETIDEAGDAANVAWSVIARRPVRSWEHLVELAHVVRDQLWHLKNGEWEQHSINEALEEALQRGIFSLAEGGANA